MARMLSQLPLPLLPSGAAEIAPGWAFSLVNRAGWSRCTGWPRSRGMAGMRRAGGWRRCSWSGCGPRRRARWPRRSGGPGHDLAVGSGAGRGRGGRAGAGPAGPKGASKLTPELAERIAGLDAAGKTLREIAAATGVSTFTVRTRWAGSRLAGSPRRPAPPKTAPARSPGTMTRARARFRCCRTRCPAMRSVPWRGGGCWARAPARCSPGCPVSAGRAAAGAAGAGRHRPAAGRPRGLRPAQGRVLRADRDAADAGVPRAGRGAAGRGRHPGAARCAGPGAGPGPGTRGQDDPPQAGRARRGREGSRPDHGAGPPPRRRPAGHAGVPPR